MQPINIVFTSTEVDFSVPKIMKKKSILSLLRPVSFFVIKITMATRISTVAVSTSFVRNQMEIPQSTAGDGVSQWKEHEEALVGQC